MNEIHDLLAHARDGAAGGAEASQSARLEIRRRVVSGRRRRTVGVALAGVGALGIVGAATTAVALGARDDAAPAAPASTTPKISASASASPSVTPDPVYDDFDGPVEVELVGDGTVTFSASSEADAGSIMSAAPSAGPTFDPIDAATIERLRDGGALVTASVDEPDGLFEKQSSELFLAFADGSSEPVIDLKALAEDLGLRVGGEVPWVEIDSDGGRVLLGFDDLDGNYVLLLWDMLSGKTTILAEYTDAEVVYTGPDSESWMGITWDQIVWDGDRWLVWTTVRPTTEDEIARNVMISIAPDGSSWSTEGLWVDQIETYDEEEAGTQDAELPGNPSSLPGVALWLGGVEGIGWFAVNDDGALVELCPTEWGDVLCRAIGTTPEGQVVVMEGKQPYVVDLDSGERTPMPGVSKRAVLGGESAPLGDGYVELPFVYNGSTTALWHRPDGDVEIEVPSQGDYLWSASSGTSAWLTSGDFLPYVAVIGTDGVWREVELGIDAGGEMSSAAAQPFS